MQSVANGLPVIGEPIADDPVKPANRRRLHLAEVQSRNTNQNEPG